MNTSTETLPAQSLDTSAILALVAILIALMEQEPLTALGIAIGAALALFSLWTFMIAVPRLFVARNPSAPILLGILTAVKLPVFALTLSYAFGALHVHPFALFAGVAVAPCVIAAYAVRRATITRGSAHTGLGTSQ